MQDVAKHPCTSVLRAVYESIENALQRIADHAKMGTRLKTCDGFQFNFHSILGSYTSDTSVDEDALSVKRGGIVSTTCRNCLVLMADMQNCSLFSQKNTF